MPISDKCLLFCCVFRVQPGAHSATVSPAGECVGEALLPDR